MILSSCFLQEPYTEIWPDHWEHSNRFTKIPLTPVTFQDLPSSTESSSALTQEPLERKFCSLPIPADPKRDYAMAKIEVQGRKLTYIASKPRGKFHYTQGSFYDPLAGKVVHINWDQREVLDLSQLSISTSPLEFRFAPRHEHEHGMIIRWEAPPKPQSHFLRNTLVAITTLGAITLAALYA